MNLSTFVHAFHASYRLKFKIFLSFPTPLNVDKRKREREKREISIYRISIN